VHHIGNAGQHLLGMISDLLDLSIIERGGFRIRPEAVALPELGRDALLLAGAQWRDDIELRSTIADDAALVVHADRLRLRQILVNLLSNGIKYNRKGGRVTLSAERRGSAIAISVTDTGRGLNAQQLAHLFEAFNRLGASNSSVQGGGIGLVISKKLAELMGGRIEVQSREGHGSTFTVWLPAAELVPAAAFADINGANAIARGAIAPSKRAAPGAVNGTVIGTEIGAATSPPQAEGAAADAGERKVVLYAEDNEINIVVISAMFELRPDLELRVARSGSEALKAARAQRPDLLLLDVHLGDMTGIELYGLLKHDPAMATLPVLALSADALPEQIAAARSAGIVRYLTKPVDCDVLLNNIDQALEEYAATQTAETSPFAPTTFTAR